MLGSWPLDIEVEGLSCSASSRKSSKQYILPIKGMENVRLGNTGDVMVGMGVGIEFRGSEKTFLSVTKAAKRSMRRNQSCESLGAKPAG